MADIQNKFRKETAPIRRAFNGLKAEQGFRQQDLADTLGITQGLVTRWINGHVRIPDMTLLRMAVVLGFDPLEVRPEIADYVELANTVLSGEQRSGLTEKISLLSDAEKKLLHSYVDTLFQRRFSVAKDVTTTRMISPPPGDYRE